MFIDDNLPLLSLEFELLLMECASAKNDMVNFSPYSNNIDSLELDYLILISVCKSNGKAISELQFEYFEINKALEFAENKYKNSKDCADAFLKQLRRILQPPEIEFSKVIIDNTLKENRIDNLKGVNSKEAVSFLQYILQLHKKSNAAQVDRILSDAISQLNVCKTNDEIISIINSIIYLYDERISKVYVNSIECSINHLTNFINNYISKKRRIISFEFKPSMVELTTELEKFKLKIKKLCWFQRLYYIFKLGFIASQCEPDLEKAFETLTNGS